MTNFERWKQTLTPEDVFHGGLFDFCGKFCPAKDYCATFPFVDFRRTKHCRVIFFEWANNESEC